MLVEPTIALARAAPLHCPHMEQVRPVGHEGHTHAPSQVTPAPADATAGTEFGPRDFRNALGRFATGITVVTMRAPGTLAEPTNRESTNGEPANREPANRNEQHTQHLSEANSHTDDDQPRTFGLTVNAFMSVSLDPPLVAVSLDKRARAHATMLAAPRFGISVLAEGQEGLSDVFAGRPVQPPSQPFEEFAGFPVVRGALTNLVLSSYQAHDAGDHTIFVGRVEALRYDHGQPLLFFKGKYENLSGSEPQR